MTRPGYPGSHAPGTSIDYRYTLDRDVAPLDSPRRRVCWVMCNPSYADDTKNDPTMTRVINFTRDNGFTDLTVVNLMAARATKPVRLLELAGRGLDVVGPQNRHHIMRAMKESEIVVCAWGRWPSVQESRKKGPVIEFPPIMMMAQTCPEGVHIRHVGRPTYCLTTGSNGEPSHPLYLPGSLRFKEYPLLTGAIFTTEYIEHPGGANPFVVRVHRSTGKYPYPAGVDHLPQWGEWFQDMGVRMRRCKFEACDIDDYEPREGFQTVAAAGGGILQIPDEITGFTPDDELTAQLIEHMSQPVRVHEPGCPFSDSSVLWGPGTPCTCTVPWLDYETGDVVPMTAEMWELAGDCWDWYRAHESNGVGGQLHIILDDNNTADSDLAYCREHIGEVVLMRDGYPRVPAPAELVALGTRILDGLQALDEPQRDAVVHHADVYGSSRPSAPVSLPPGVINDTVPDHVPGKFIEVDGGDLVVGREGVDDEVPFAHTEVRMRIPKGTDMRAAMNEAMGVFMEREDGTNAFPEWARTRWWHGGPAGLRKGDWLLPPSETGHRPGLDISDKESVYLTSRRDDALLFAARHDKPVLYEVKVDAEPLPDDLVPSDRTCCRVPKAQILRVETISNLELRRVLYEMEGTRQEELAREQALLNEPDRLMDPTGRTSDDQYDPTAGPDDIDD